MLKGKLASGDVFTLDGDVVSCAHEDMQDVLRDCVLHEYSLDYFPSEKALFPSDNSLTMH